MVLNIPVGKFFKIIKNANLIPNIVLKKMLKKINTTSLKFTFWEFNKNYKKGQKKNFVQ